MGKPSVAVVGPFPDPITGEAMANKILSEGLTKHGYNVIEINGSLASKLSTPKGNRFSVTLLLRSLSLQVRSLRIIASRIVWITPGQSFYGMMKYAFPILLAWGLRKKIILHIHGRKFGISFRALEGIKKGVFQWFTRRASLGVVLTDSLRSNFTGLLVQSEVRTVPNCYGYELENVSAANKRYDIPRVLFLSNLMVSKGVLDVLQAFSLIDQAGIPFTLNLAGHIDQNDEKLIRSRLNEFKSFATYLGPVAGQTKIDLLIDSNIFVLPTYYKVEGQPISIIEAMATGNYIISTKHSGIPETMDESNGSFVRPQTPEDIFSEVKNLNLEMSKVRDIGLTNYRMSRSKFNPDRYINDIRTILDEVE